MPGRIDERMTVTGKLKEMNRFEQCAEMSCHSASGELAISETAHSGLIALPELSGWKYFLRSRMNRRIVEPEFVANLQR